MISSNLFPHSQTQSMHGYKSIIISYILQISLIYIYLSFHLPPYKIKEVASSWDHHKPDFILVPT